MNATPTATARKLPAAASITAHAVDDAVAAVLLTALTPEQVALALAAADEVTGQHQRASRAAELAVERARYEADRAERAFSQVEPENRLVARTLEARWEAKLAALADAEQALQAAQDALPPLPDRASLAKLAADLPALWHAPTTTARDRKRLLRTLIADVTLLPEADRGKARIGIRWHTGAADQIVIDRPRPTGSTGPHAHPGHPADPRTRPRHQQRRPGRHPRPARIPHRRRPPVRHQSRPVGPPRLPDPQPVCLPRRGDQRRRRRPPTRLQPRRRLLLDRERAAGSSPQPRRQAVHPLDPGHRGGLPGPHRQLRAPQPGRPAHQAPPAPLNTTSAMSAVPGTITPARPDHPANPETSRQEGQYEITVPSWSDKLVGEVVRLLLEAYYEPQFSDRSHGFRKGRGCHTALREIQQTWTGTVWFIEGDISDCFGSFRPRYPSRDTGGEDPR